MTVKIISNMNQTVVHRGQSLGSVWVIGKDCSWGCDIMTLVSKDEQDLTKRSRKTNRSGCWKNENHPELIVAGSEYSQWWGIVTLRAKQKLCWVKLGEQMGTQTEQYHFWSKWQQFTQVCRQSKGGLSKSLESTVGTNLESDISPAHCSIPGTRINTYWRNTHTTYSTRQDTFVYNNNWYLIISQGAFLSYINHEMFKEILLIDNHISFFAFFLHQMVSFLRTTDFVLYSF